MSPCTKVADVHTICSALQWWSGGEALGRHCHVNFSTQRNPSAASRPQWQGNWRMAASTSAWPSFGYGSSTGFSPRPGISSAPRSPWWECPSSCWDQDRPDVGPSRGGLPALHRECIRGPSRLEDRGGGNCTLPCSVGGRPQPLQRSDYNYRSAATPFADRSRSTRAPLGSWFSTVTRATFARSSRSARSSASAICAANVSSK
jgi:hypothetical protein